MIETLSIAIAVLGASLLAVLYSRIRTVEAGLSLAKHRSKAAGVADLLNYAAVVDDGVIVGKNGSFIAGWLYKGDDNASSTDEQREIISFRLNQALSRLGNGWMLHVDAVRRAAPAYSDRKHSSFDDDVTQAIDEERRRFFEGLGEMYEGYFVVSLTWFPPALAQRKFVELMFDDDSERPSRTRLTMDLIEQFKREIQTIESRLSSAVSLTRLRGRKVVTEEGRELVHDDLLSWIQFCLTGNHHAMQLPPNPMYLDAVLGGQEFRTGVVPRIGRKFIQVVAIEGFPATSSPGLLAALAEQPCEYRWSTRFIFMDQHEAVSHLQTFRKKWKQKVRGFFDQVFNLGSSQVNLDAVAMVDDADASLGEVNSGSVGMGYYTTLVVLMDEDRHRLESAALTTAKLIDRLGFAARVESINTVDAFLGSLPGHGVENVRRPLINTMVLADLLPTSSIWTGNLAAPCPFYPPLAPALMHCVTHGSTPFRLNLHVRDLGHTFVFGPTGAGKSSKLAMLAAQLRRYRGMSIFSFDKGMSMYPLAAAIRARTRGRTGLHFSVAADDSRLAFCPLQFLETPGDRAWAMEWIDTMLALNGVITTPALRNSIAAAIMSMHENNARTLSEFVTTVQNETIREALHQYTIDGVMGHLLDAAEDGLTLSDFTVFEIEELMGLGDKFALPVLLYLFRRIERALKGQPAAIILDEAWVMLGHDVFRQKIREWLKVLRKANCIVILATQSLTDAERSGILDVLVESTATKIFLANVFARDENMAALYRRMGLNNRQIEILATAIPKQDYYYVSEQGRRLYSLALGPVALAFAGATDKESVARIKQLEKKYEENWVTHWLKDRGLNLDDYLKAGA